MGNRKKKTDMNQFRGMLMLVAAGIAFWRGWKIHTGHVALLGYALGTFALGLAIWHMTRKPDKLRSVGKPRV